MSVYFYGGNSNSAVLLAATAKGIRLKEAGDISYEKIQLIAVFRCRTLLWPGQN